MKIAKYIINFLLLIVLVIILIQNSAPVEVELLMWKVSVPLSLLLFGMAVAGAIISFLTVLIIGRTSSINTAK